MCTDLVMTDHMADTNIPSTTHIPSFVTVAHIEEYLPAANQNKLANQNKHANELYNNWFLTTNPCQNTLTLCQNYPWCSHVVSIFFTLGEFDKFKLGLHLIYTWKHI